MNPPDKPSNNFEAAVNSNEQQLQNTNEKSREKVVDEHFVKTKSDAMCGHPRKIKFQYYNINMSNYDNAIYHQAREHFE